jgi:hypothetical protein
MIPRTVLAALVLLVGGGRPVAQHERERTVTVLLAQSARDSMGIIFQRYNQHWDELSDLTTLERMLGTVRPTQLEYLGCLRGTVDQDTVRVESWIPAADMKQLPLAVDGNCDHVPRLVGTWHTHPFRADLQNRAVKERTLSRQDLATFGASDLRVTMVMWDVDSVDAAVMTQGGVSHPATVVIR